MTKGDEKLPLRPVVQCVLCSQEYDRKGTGAYRLLGVFENYCLCEACLYQDTHGGEGRQQSSSKA